MSWRHFRQSKQGLVSPQIFSWPNLGTNMQQHDEADVSVAAATTADHNEA